MDGLSDGPIPDPHVFPAPNGVWGGGEKSPIEIAPKWLEIEDRYVESRCGDDFVKVLLNFNQSNCCRTFELSW